MAPPAAGEVRMRAVDLWLRFMAPLFLAAALVLLGIAIIYGGELIRMAG